ncbi:Asp-tRNA(Asn)/Glu-tRNA(Gln) amidotransferase subunit GatA [Phaeocystidibacter marisrubri]|uniref:Glutamyl-tRNA(Gln) amidotransferase subunit A n=1 Tax=Phaeocystidibacter marisrubri TaxID=1577780 RepID=A0A6L3ZG52_9FLAO|nr:Asp-tRNA(Asn)/Glu-tRNA(Gln) amidotransferase subunit GatA [Phaeocystidibacter marisrubri]KAB2816387.1 Asp-tRNA(Asn)/Glu-tRNA(Gln) amidotransferase subunit GatA [Phaeocystidibacter marisrubri]GGH68799.1 glutamyl-tRNA(Gln) amidotransferase subunit A [Phaeocystidibacter marisrubri]
MEYTRLADLQADLKNGNAKMIDVVNNLLERIETYADHNIFLEVFAGDARERATVIDQKFAHGSQGKLAGLVISIKDNMCYSGHKVSAASKILENFESLFTATAVQRLIDEDAIIIGRTNCDEFAMGSSNENSAYGAVKNPLNTALSPGGSSGGAAASVAAGLCHVALGSDTGGSIRQPASFCGVVGHKPTYGRVSRYGLIAYASSFDQIGPFAKNVEDAALVMEVMGGADPMDSTCSQREADVHGDLSLDPQPLKVAVYKDLLNREGINPEIVAHMNAQMEQLKSKGHEIVEVDFPHLDTLVPIYYILTTAEASSNLARYDGVHFGYRSENATDLESTYKRSRTEGFGEEVKRRIMLGTFVLSSGYYDAYYGKAQRARKLIQEHTDAILKEADVILIPTSPHTAFPLNQELNDPTVMYLEDIFTVQANIAGNPAISIPTGKHSNGMPFGIQLMTGRFEDDKLLRIANAMMKG